jgi:hypothetical protein
VEFESKFFFIFSSILSPSLSNDIFAKKFPPVPGKAGSGSNLTTAM